MRAIELGRAARAQAKVKNRQPLRRAVIVATEAERAEIERLAELVRAELNVKELEFVSEEGELVRYAVKPNYRALGPRFGKAMPQVAAAVEALDPDHVAEAIRGERRIGINIDGAEHTLEPDDLTLVMQPLDGYEVEAEAGRAVALALELDDELMPRGPRARDRARGPERPQAGRPRRLRPDRADARRRRGTGRGRPRATRTTSPARRWRRRSPTTAPGSASRRRSRAASWGSGSRRASGAGSASAVDLDLHLHVLVERCR